MKTYIIHLRPVPYGFEIKAETPKQALEIAEKRWAESNGTDYDFEADYDSNFKVISEIND